MTAGARSTVAVSVRDLRKSYSVRRWVPGRRRSTVVALAGIELTVESGSIHGIIGPNGSGKSTLLRVLATTVLPDSGHAEVYGRDVVAEPSAVKRMTGLSAGEERSLYWRLTARQNLEFAAALFGVPDAGKAIAAMLEVVELENEADRPVSGFSQGMARRLGLARALLHQPSLLLLDEPSRSLDPGASAHLHQVLRRIRDEKGVTTVLTTHDLSEAAECCDEVSSLHAGRVTGRVSPPAEASPHGAVTRLLA